MQNNTKTSRNTQKGLNLSDIELGKNSPFASIPVKTQINMDDLIDLSVLSDVSTMTSIERVREHMEYLMYYVISCESFVTELDGRERSNFLFHHNYLTKLLTSCVWLLQDTESSYFNGLREILDSEEIAYKSFYAQRKAKVIVPDLASGEMVEG